MGGIIRRNSDVLLVANRRKDTLKDGGRDVIDWSPPGGVVDQGEGELEALEREVYEETGIRVSTWSEFIYGVDVNFQEHSMHLRVKVFEAIEWNGSIVVNDPDGIVEDAEFFSKEDCEIRLKESPVWVREPFLAYLKNGITLEKSFSYEVASDDSGNLIVKRNQ